MTGGNLPTRTSVPGCFRTVGITFVVLAALAIPVLFWLSHMVMKVPRLRNFALCTIQVEEIGGALNRYAKMYDRYPDTIDELYPRFIENKSVLHCPSDSSKTDKTSYQYAKPSLDAPADKIMVTCTRHTPFEKGTHVLVGVRKDGTKVILPIPAKSDEK